MRRSTRVLTMTLLGGLAACAGSGEEQTVGGAKASPASATKPVVAIADQDMIVLFRDQLPNVAAPRGARHARKSAIANAQAPLIDGLQQTQARSVQSFGLVNAFAAKLSATEVEQLSAHPAVLAVVPDAMIRLPKRFKDKAGPGRGSSGSPSASAPSASMCDTLEPEALQVTNTAFRDPSTPQAHEVVDGNGQKVTGRGVKVAFIADGIDTNNPGFIRPDGTSAFIDYQDFSGDPAGTPTAGGEAFGDASSIGAQDFPNGNPYDIDISQFVTAAHPLPSPCNVRVRGMAPGASMVGLKVFSNLGYTTTSTFVQAIEWAVVHDDVDVLNESFGSNPFPDFTKDPISLANEAAVRAGVTVTISTGDAGTATIGSPSTGTSFIATGASTTFRLYAQTGDGMMPLANGFLSDNISSLSSGGFAQKNPRTVDLVAPGDLGWALCSTSSDLFNDCGSYNGGPSPIQAFGGTSEAAPLTAGAAALVIQAYRSTHGGQHPSPALVKEILMSSSSDLGASSDEQGAGRIDGLAAVQMALSVSDENGSPHHVGTGLLASPSSARITAQTNDLETSSFLVTNTGATTRQLAPALETLGAPFAGHTYNLQLNPATDPTFSNVFGDDRPYIRQTFTVPAGADHLDAAIALPPTVGGNQTIGALALLDPSGRQAAYSIPQGLGSGYAHVDVTKPAAGTWTAIIRTTPIAITSSYTGPVQLTWSAEKYVTLGNVYPSRLNLRPGDSAWITAVLSAPAQPGDLAAAIRLHDTARSHAATSEIPVTIRTLIPVGPTGGSFTSTLTGGNGRSDASPTSTFAFDVPNGVNDMSLSLAVPDVGYSIAGYLVDPNGMALSTASNVDLYGAPQLALQLFRANPQPGRWRFVLSEILSAGRQTSVPVTGRIGFNSASVAASGLPHNRHTKLSAAAAPVSVPVVVTNTGSSTRAFFADARLGSYVDVALSTNLCAKSPTTLPGLCAYSYIPSQAARVQFSAQATAPITMNAVWGSGGPDLYARQVGTNSVVASVGSPEVAYGYWYLLPSLIGPFGPGGAQTASVTTSVTASILAFDPTVAADSGDLWTDVTLGTSTFQPLVLAPGASGTINVTITPDPAKIGKVVAGTLYVDTYNWSDAYGSGDEVTSLPYEYTVAP